MPGSVEEKSLTCPMCNHDCHQKHCNSPYCKWQTCHRHLSDKKLIVVSKNSHFVVGSSF